MIFLLHCIIFARGAREKLATPNLRLRIPFDETGSISIICAQGITSVEVLTTAHDQSCDSQAVGGSGVVDE